MIEEINPLHNKLSQHRLYGKLNTLDSVRTFMKYHAFAVWDFMSLLKSLQREITSVSVPWNESAYSPELVRLINEIVLGEESDIDQDGNPCSHFSLYLKAMEEVGADTGPIKSYIFERENQLLPREIKEITHYHLELAETGDVHEVASSFFFGREKLIPLIFDPIVKVLEKEQLSCPTLIYYLKRHIELDGDEHGPMAMRCLDVLVSDEEKKDQALKVALKSLSYREMLWDYISDRIEEAH